MAVIQPPLDQPHQQTQSWQKTVADKIEADIGKIPPQWILDPHVVAAARDRRKIAGEFIESLLDNDRSHITSMDVVQLVNEMGTGQLSAVQVVTAFSKRAAYAHQLSDILLEIGFDIGIKQARKLDQYFEEHRELIGPLHGVPVTLKDQFHVKGLGTSMAFAGWIGTFEGCKDTGKEKSFESQLVTDLISLGAVPIGKTPLVQSIWAMRGAPHNQLLSTGGSSGGEGAIQALRGSAFSVDTNIGGSVSMPASFHGVFSLKPSANRMPFRGVANTGPGQQVMPTVAGFMGHSIETLEVVFKSILSTKPWIRDPMLLPIPWREDRELGGDKQLYKPSFGYMADDGLVTPHPAIDWALRIVKSALQHLDYDIIEWQPPSANESIQIHGPIARGDGCPDVFGAIQLSGEPIVPEISHFFPDGKLRDPLPLPEWENVVIHMKAYRERWLDYCAESLLGRPVEAVLAPVSPYAAVLPGKFYHSPYSSMVNVLDYTAILVPVTFAEKAEDQVPSDFHPLTDKDRMSMDSYDADIYHGAPASIQLLGRRLDEERLLSMAKLVVEALESYRDEDGK